MPGGTRPPVEVVANWPAPDYENPERHGPALTILCSLLGPLAFFIVGSRLWARFFLSKNAGLDDWLIMIALIPMLGLLICIGIASQNYGFDRHIWDNRLSTIITQRKLIFATGTCYLASNGLIKCSILLFYRRLTMKAISPTYVLTIRIALTSVIISTVALLVVQLVGCHPLSAYWDQVMPTLSYEYYCIDETAPVMSAFVISFLQDFIATTLPFTLYWKMLWMLPVRQMVAMGAIFAIGYIVCVIAVVRIYYTYIVFYVSYDMSWISRYIWIWMLLEIFVASMCASAPGLKVFFRNYFGGDESEQKRGVTC